jgi:flagellar biosynthesis/type III secretory pathway protein FliH
MRTKVLKGISFKGKPSITGGLVKRSVLDAINEAKRTIADAEAEAERIRLQAKRDALKEEEVAYKEGYKNSLYQLNQYLIETRERRDTSLSEVRADLLKLSIKIAERIIGQKIDQNSIALNKIVDTALNKISNKDRLTISINPSDMEFIKEQADLIALIDGSEFIDLTSNIEVRNGEAILECDAGKFIVELGTELSLLKNLLFKDS